MAVRLEANVVQWPACCAVRTFDGAPTRSAGRRWSTPATYATYAASDRRLVLMLTDDDPLYPNWDRDITAVYERYGEQDPDTVAAGLVAAGAALAARVAGVHDEHEERPGRRSDGVRFTIGSFARYLLHDPVLHLHDVTR